MKTIDAPGKPTSYSRYAHELALSVYSSGVAIWANDALSGGHNCQGDRTLWVLQMEALLTRDSHPPSLVDDPKLRFAFAFVWAVAALGIFLLLRLSAQLVSLEKIVCMIGGTVAVSGFPIAFVYARRNYTLPLFEIVAALICIYLYLYRNWPRKAFWSVLLLILHCGFWSWCAWALRHYPALGDPAAVAIVPLLWPGAKLTRITTEAPELIYPWLGFLATLAWGLYARQSMQRSASVC